MLEGEFLLWLFNKIFDEIVKSVKTEKIIKIFEKVRILKFKTIEKHQLAKLFFYTKFLKLGAYIKIHFNFPTPIEINKFF